ncbi:MULTISPECIES: 16S rRNA (cytidine(1402)-2'-O)-methyltransferase [Prauserella salsuginis group]|uniref:Ribosomal RNA small subunit methyltransferase I n=2 Tax=Prauserella salsuginis group TaxID=2893672 RepID=A0A839XI77_9PSEU|nr:MULTISPECIES: 16S rRNA (cytidine(1402)-2'-O)-methyltransferase [Prauserella salsuginis group]MBB3663662.1 16S rRNA (cytidine1402-2'-O)-methyltransferase [Prauserella sediminis]MCR3722557.1 16S rRNA (cytidine1402-2'-O)-methyltransferase [Prauserella flava]MCR3736999.1 16S rRNA (cytidine1402-2'-O)-methyltransferase [Prauserella salsuginis]
MPLILAGTPLGDRSDASPRLAEALRTADVIAAEDTRRLRSLATALDVAPAAKVVSFYEDVESARLPKLLDAVREGDTVVLVTDAGMPSVSDPGFRLVAACAEEDLPVSCVPGPSAVTTALALSGLAPDRFCFDGFAPRKPGERARWFAELAEEKRTTVFFESPHRLASLLADAAARLGADRRAAVCRELTKTYEQVRRGTLGELAEWAADGVRGEITVVLAGAAPRDVSVADLVGEVTRRVEAGERLKAVAAEVAKETGVSKKELYDAVVAARPD